MIFLTEAQERWLSRQKYLSKLLYQLENDKSLRIDPFVELLVCSKPRNGKLAEMGSFNVISGQITRSALLEGGEVLLLRIWL